MHLPDAMLMTLRPNLHAILICAMSLESVNKTFNMQVRWVACVINQNGEKITITPQNLFIRQIAIFFIKKA